MYCEKLSLDENNVVTFLRIFFFNVFTVVVVQLMFIIIEIFAPSQRGFFLKKQTFMSINLDGIIQDIKLRFWNRHDAMHNVINSRQQ